MANLCISSLTTASDPLSDELREQPTSVRMVSGHRLLSVLSDYFEEEHVAGESPERMALRLVDSLAGARVTFPTDQQLRALELNARVREVLVDDPTAENVERLATNFGANKREIVKRLQAVAGITITARRAELRTA